MKFSFFALLSFLLLLAPLSQAADKNSFHPPQTEAERALDNIFFRVRNADDHIYDFLLGRPYDDHSKDSEFSALFTKPLLKAWALAQVQALKENCGGRYREGTLCGLDYNVLVCGQDSPDVFFYRTIKMKGTEAVITYTWPEYLERGVLQDGPTYRMVREGTAWKLDGAYCGKGKSYGFNMPDDGYLSGAR